MGRPRKPAALRALEGGKALDDGPVPPVGDPQPPDWLSAEALACWERLAPSLIERGVLTPWDVEEFASYCDAVALRAEAAGHLAEEGTVVEAPVFDRNGTQQPAGRPTKNIWASVWKDANDVAARRASRFGLTPSDRTQLPAHAQDGAASSVDDFFAPDPGRLLS